MHQEQDQSRAGWRFGGVTRKRAIGGAMALVGIVVLISFIGKGHLVAMIAAAGLLVSGLVLITAVVTTETARPSVNTLRAWQRIVSNAGTQSAEPEAQRTIAIKDTGLMQVRIIEGSTPLMWTTQEDRATNQTIYAPSPKGSVHKPRSGAGSRNDETSFLERRPTAPDLDGRSHQGDR